MQGCGGEQHLEDSSHWACRVKSAATDLYDLGHAVLTDNRLRMAPLLLTYFSWMVSGGPGQEPTPLEAVPVLAAAAGAVTYLRSTGSPVGSFIRFVNVAVNRVGMALLLGLSSPPPGSSSRLTQVFSLLRD